MNWSNVCPASAWFASQSLVSGAGIGRRLSRGSSARRSAAGSASERTFQLLAQAAGRAGRGDAPGRVLVQTFYPDYYAVRFAADRHFEAFYEKEIRFRRTMRYPPVVALANVVAQDSQLEKAAGMARKIQEFFQSVEKPAQDVRILGPAPAPLARLEGKYRIQFLLRSKSRARLHGVLERLAAYCHRHGILPHSLMIDVDPVSVM